MPAKLRPLGRGRFVPNPRGIAKVGRDPKMYALVKGLAERGADNARSVAPVGDSDPGEHYKDMISVYTGLRKGIAFARINAHKFTSHWIEFGTSRMQAFAPLRRGMELLGLRLRAKGDE